MAKQADFTAAQARITGGPIIRDNLDTARIEVAIACGALPVARLCYVKDAWAYFTTAALEDQWGDDWDDAPYEHNAGDPYEWRPHMDCAPYEIIKVAFDAWMLATPAQTCGINSPFSVQRINNLDVPWLGTSGWTKPADAVEIWAGTTLQEFVAAVESMGGTVYFPRRTK